MVTVSIIIPHFNRSILLEQTIESVLAQTFKEWEVIVVDDGSDKLEFDKIKQYENGQNIKVLQRLTGTKGPSGCRNLGAKMAKGKYLLFLDSDDLLAPFCLGQRVAIMEEDDKVQLGIFKMLEFNKTPGDSNNVYNKDIPSSDWTGSFVRNENPWNVTCPIWRKETFDNINGFDEEMLFMEDPEIHLRIINIANAQIKTCYDKPADCYYRVNHVDDTKKNFYYNSILYRILFYKKILFGKYPQSFIAECAVDIKIGIYSLIRTFLFSRKNKYPSLYIDLAELIKDSKLFTSFEMFWLTFLINTGNTESWIVRRLKLRGICYKLLPVK